MRARQGQDAEALVDARRAIELHPSDLEAVGLAAHLEKQAGRLDVATELLRNGLQANPRDESLRVLLAQTLRTAGDDAGAVEALAKGLELVPLSRTLRARLAQTHRELGQGGDAERVLREGVALEPEDVDLRIASARLGFQLHGLEAAESNLRESIEKLPREWTLQLALAELYDTAGQDIDSAKIYERIAAIEDAGPSAIVAKNKLAAAKAGREDLDGARQLVDQILEKHPNNRDALALRGTLALLRNDPTSAIADFRLVLANHPDQTQVLRLRARAHLLNNEVDQARRDLREAADRDINDVQSRLELAELLNRYSDTAGAAAAARERLLEEAGNVAGARVQQNPKDATAHLTAGIVSLARNDPAAAIKALETALELDPSLQSARRLVARAHARNDEIDKALASARAAVDANSGDIRAKLDLAIITERAGDLTAARAAYDEVIDKAPGNEDALEALVRLSLNAGQPDDALSSARKLVAAAPERPTGYYLSGRILQRQGRTDDSVAAYREALKRSPNAVEPLLALASVLAASDQLDEAQALVERRLASNPKDVAALNQLGEIRLRAGRTEEAEDLFKKAMALDPRWDVPHRNLGMARQATGDDEGAARALVEGAEAADTPKLVYDLATQYERMNRPELAIEQYERFLRRVPGSVAAVNNLAVLLATYRTDEPSLRRAMDLAERLSTQDHPAFLDTIGWVYFKNGDLDRALAALEQAVRGAPDDSEFRYHLGMVHHARGEAEKAAEQLTKALAGQSKFRGAGEARSTLRSLRQP